ncbi:MAG: aspartate/glutamate racemase family protein [Ramlibacter sp.]
MRELLVVNPNTSESVTELLRAHVQTAAGSQVSVRAVTARFGSTYIADDASYAVAAHSTFDAWSTALLPPRRAPDAVLIGCFGDPGLLALRAASPVPVGGLAESSFIEAAQHGPFAIVTGGEKWDPILRRVAQAMGFAQALAGIRTVVPTGAELAADPEAARALLTQACRDAAREFDARTIIIGGAGLAGFAAMLQPGVEVPLIDSVAAGARWAQRALQLPNQPWRH